MLEIACLGGAGGYVQKRLATKMCIYIKEPSRCGLMWVLAQRWSETEMLLQRRAKQRQPTLWWCGRSSRPRACPLRSCQSWRCCLAPLGARSCFPEAGLQMADSEWGIGRAGQSLSGIQVREHTGR